MCAVATCVSGVCADVPDDSCFALDTSFADVRRSDAGADVADVGDPDLDERWLTIFQGEAFTRDERAACNRHDAIAVEAEPFLRDSGNFGHNVFLSEGGLGAEGLLLSIERWSSFDDMLRVYSDPESVAGISSLFLDSPTREFFVEGTLHGWGDFNPPDARLVIVRGYADEGLNERHRALYEEGEGELRRLGLLARRAYVGVDDPREYVSIEWWRSTSPIETLYTDPIFARRLGELFESVPTLTTLRGTNWHQW